MAQHQMKKKTSLPIGAKQRSLKREQKSANSQRVRKGGNIFVAPKKANAIQQAKISSEVSRIINEKNESSIRTRSDNDVGRVREPKTPK